MTTHKRYRLLKPLPDYKVGEPFEWDEDSGYYKAVNPCEDGVHGRWPPKYVENNPEWFEEIIPEEKTEQPSNDSFTWTDELVKNYLANILCGKLSFGKYETPDKTIRQFKQSKSTPASPSTDKSLSTEQPKENVFMNVSENPMRDLCVMKYTQSEMDKAIADAFNAAREQKYIRHHSSMKILYPTLNDYLQSLNQDKKQ